MEPAHIYDAVIRSVYDGDTLRADIDTGFGIWKSNEPLRLYGINAPEVRGAEREQGIIITRDWLREKLPEGTHVVVQTFQDKKGKYGRYIATIWLDGVNLNEQMVELGLAVGDYLK